jgi:hypothetical protein
MDQRRLPATRRALVGATGAGLAGCLDDGGEAASTDPSPSPSERHGQDPADQHEGDPSKAARERHQSGFPGVLVTTDGNTVTALDADGVIAEDADAGVVMGAVMDVLADDEGPPGRHVHFTRGIFRWHQQVTTAVPGVRITGEWNGTRWYADSEIRSFLRFAAPDSWILRGPKISHLQYHGKGNADFFLELDTVSEAAVEHVYGTGSIEGMIHGNPEEGRRNLDHCSFRECHVRRGGALAVMESGAGGIPADCKFETCVCLDPNTYGFVFRDVGRMQIDRVFTGITPDADGEGCVLVENPGVGDSAAAKRKTMGCRIHMAEIEDKRDGADSVCVHVRTPEGAESGASYGHRLTHLRAQQREQAKFLVVENHGPGTLEGVTLRGLQVRPRHEEAIVIDGAVECDLQFGTRGGKAPYPRVDGVESDPRTFVDDRGTRTIVNGVSYNAGSPTETGQWNGHGHEGVIVVDTDGGGLYTYADGQWWSLGTPAE